jgi:hypothetical protein
MANNENLKPFKKGYDPRRNLKGVPRDAVEMRKAIRKVAAELLTVKERQEDGSIVEYDLTRLEALIRLKFSSKAPADFITILKALAPGLLKDELDLTSGGEQLRAPTVIEVVKSYDAEGAETYRPLPAPAAPPAEPDEDGTE